MSALHPIMAQALAGIAPPPRTVEWKVTLDFRKGPTFSGTATAPDMESAITLAKSFAKRCGFTGEVRYARAVRV